MSMIPALPLKSAASLPRLFSSLVYDAEGPRNRIKIRNIVHFRTGNRSKVDVYFRRSEEPGKIYIYLSMPTDVANDLMKSFLRAVKVANHGMNFQLRVNQGVMQLSQKRSMRDTLETWRELGKPKIDLIRVLINSDQVKSVMYLLASEIVVPTLVSARSFDVILGSNNVNTPELGDEEGGFRFRNFVPVEKYVVDDGSEQAMDADLGARLARLYFTNKERVFPPGIARLIQSFVGAELPEGRYHRYSAPVPAPLKADWESVLRGRREVAARQEATKKSRMMLKRGAAAVDGTSDMGGDQARSRTRSRSKSRKGSRK